MNRRSQRGVTLLEMMIVVSLMALMVGVTFPAVTSGIDSLRLRAATDSIVSNLSAALNRAERRQIAMEVIILPAENLIRFASADPGYRRELQMPEGVIITRILPEIPGVEPAATRAFLMHPGGVVPRIAVEVTNRRGAKRLVSVDPITQTARITIPEAQR